jgi:hypothetical protein
MRRRNSAVASSFWWRRLHRSCRRRWRLQPALGIVVAWFGEHARCQALLDGLRGAVAPAADLVQPMPYCALQSLVDAGNPPGRRLYWRSDNLRALGDDTIDTLVACANRATSPFSNIILQPGGHAIAAVPEGRHAARGARCAVAGALLRQLGGRRRCVPLSPG